MNAILKLFLLLFTTTFFLSAQGDAWPKFKSRTLQTKRWS